MRASSAVMESRVVNVNFEINAITLTIIIAGSKM
jgi:hypothetical protein